MKVRIMKLTKKILLGVLLSLSLSQAQEIRWLRVSELQSFVCDLGMEYESQGTTGNTNYFSWPTQYSIDQNTVRSRLLWIGCKDFFDTVENRVKSVKVIGAGPRDFQDRSNQIFEQEIKLIAKTSHPIVTVGDLGASVLDQYDIPDEVDPDLPCDRMVLVRINTSIGISLTKKVMVFANSEHGNYFIYDYVFKNTGIVNRAGTVRPQTLDSLWFYFAYRYAFAGVSSSGWGSTWGAFASTWGNSTLHHAFGQNPSASEFTYNSSPMRGFFSWYGPNSESNNSSLTYAEDWGCPDITEGTGMLGSAKYAGCITLHVDAGPQNSSDDQYQPRTTWYIGGDIQSTQPGSLGQYDEVVMSDRYSIMSEGHPPQQHDQAVGEGNYPADFSDPRRSNAMQGQGFGPYRLAPGDSIHIVFAEAVSGISWEKGKEVGNNWLQWYNGTDQPTLILPGGSTTTDYNLYKRQWVETGKDSLIKTFHNAIDNYSSGYTLPQPPLPPSEFTVQSGGNRIRLTWADDAASHPNFGGYVIYRSKGNVLDYTTVYEKIFECDKTNAVHEYDDVTAVRGFYYYYYIQSKDDGTQIPGTVLYSSLFWAMTTEPATLTRPAIPTSPLPFGFPTTKWIVMNDRGAWIPYSMYFRSDSIADAVTYEGSTYVCIRDSSIDSTAPSQTDTVWRRVTLRGAWVSGTSYEAYDAVIQDEINYFTPFSISGGQGLDLVRVVPNPYDIRGRFFQFGDKSQYDQIAVYGLPTVAKLKVFTERGDLIWEKEHTSGTGDVLWSSQTMSGQIIASGVYILVVETPDNGSVIRKFVVIR